MFRENEETLGTTTLELRQTEALEAIAKSLSYLVSDQCEACKQEAYNQSCDNPPPGGWGK